MAWKTRDLIDGVEVERGPNGGLLIPPAAGTNLIEATALADRPRDALSQLRDIAEWLGSEGHFDLVYLADDLAGFIGRRYPETV